MVSTCQYRKSKNTTATQCFRSWIPPFITYCFFHFSSTSAHLFQMKFYSTQNGHWTKRDCVWVRYDFAKFMHTYASWEVLNSFCFLSKYSVVMKFCRKLCTWYVTYKNKIKVMVCIHKFIHNYAYRYNYKFWRYLIVHIKSTNSIVMERL